MKKMQGVTLIELMVTIAIIAILAAFAIPSYNKYQKTNRLREAQSKLIENANYLEKYYAKNYKFFQTDASLPNASTRFFDIEFSTNGICTGEASSADTDRYCMIAKAKSNYTNQEKRVLKMTQTGALLLCNENTDSSACEPF